MRANGQPTSPMKACIPLALAALLALASLFLAAIRVKEGHTIMLFPEHVFGLGALCLLFVATSAVAVLCKGTPKHVIKDDFAPSCLPTQPPMSDQPQCPIKRLLDVPDLVWKVFEQLDPASRRAFFQAHRDVAQNGHVLAHTKLRIELSPESLEDQWQRVLRLTRYQPPRCLVIAGPSKKRLWEFLCWAPEGRLEEKQRALQGTELQLQVHVNMEIGGVPRLQDMMRSWHYEQQQQQQQQQQSGAQDTRVQLVLDLCGQELFPKIDLVPPSCCTLRNGTLQLRGNSCVRVASDRVHLESTSIKGTDMHKAVVEVLSGGRLVMEECLVEGVGGLVGGAVRVGGAGASLCAQRCNMQSSKGQGLYVCDGGKTALEHVTNSSCGWHGVKVIGKGSVVSAAHCCMDVSRWSNVVVEEGGFACLHHCSCNGGGLHGWEVRDQGSRVVASDSSTNSNGGCGAAVHNESTASLSHVTSTGNGWHAWQVSSQGNLVASDSSASSNSWCGVAVSGGSANLFQVHADENGQHGLSAVGQASSLEASDSSASSNKNCGVAVRSGSNVSLSRVTASENGEDGWDVSGQGSELVASDSSSRRNKECGASVDGKCCVTLSHVTASENVVHGWEVSDLGTRLGVFDSSTRNNKDSGLYCFQGSNASLYRVTASENGGAGWGMTGLGTHLVASESSTSGNEWDGAALFDGASASLSACTAKDNRGTGWYTDGSAASSLEEKSCQAFNNSGDDTGEASDG